MMKCAYHADREVRGVCSSCGRPICEECLVNLGGQPYCKACLQARMQRPARQVNGFVRFMLSLAPGIGHLYLGLFNRGMQFFVGTILGAILLGMLFPEILGLYIPAVIFFSIFDAREAHMRMAQGLEVEDKGFIETKDVRLQFQPRYVGYGLVGVGVLALYRVLVNDLFRFFFDDRYWQVREAVNGMTLGLLAIAGGLYLLKRNTGRGQY